MSESRHEASSLSSRARSVEGSLPWTVIQRSSLTDEEAKAVDEMGQAERCSATVSGGPVHDHLPHRPPQLTAVASGRAPNARLQRGWEIGH
jgi:hypothetical protein